MSKAAPDPKTKTTISEPWKTSPELSAKLQTCDSEIKDHIIDLKSYIEEQIKINKKLHRKNIRLEAENQSLKNRLEALKTESE
jgi:predicted nuclease with TOPRIM domain